MMLILSWMHRSFYQYIPPYVPKKTKKKHKEISNQLEDTLGILSRGLAAPSQHIHRYSPSRAMKNWKNEKFNGADILAQAELKVCRCVSTKLQLCSARRRRGRLALTRPLKIIVSRWIFLLGIWVSWYLMKAEDLSALHSPLPLPFTSSFPWPRRAFSLFILSI